MNQLLEEQRKQRQLLQEIKEQKSRLKEEEKLKLKLNGEIRTLLEKNKNMEEVLQLNTEKDNEFLRKCLSRSLIDSYGRESRKLVKIIDMKNEILQKNELIRQLKDELLLEQGKAPEHKQILMTSMIQIPEERMDNQKLYQSALKQESLR